MTAASYWSLLAPGIEMATESGTYGEDGQWAFVPVAVGFVLGAGFVFGTDKVMTCMVCLQIVHPCTINRDPVLILILCQPKCLFSSLND